MNKTVSFSGYRDDKLEIVGTDYDDLFNKTFNVVLSLYKQGYTRFLCGMANGFDTIAARSVVSAKYRHSDIEFVAVIPYKGDESRYLDLLEYADTQIVVSQEYNDGVFLRRNDYLLENSSVLVCYHTNLKGGTYYTFNRARDFGHRIINIAE